LDKETVCVPAKVILTIVIYVTLEAVKAGCDSLTNGTAHIQGNAVVEKAVVPYLNI
jgi:hypothetical protein